MERVLVALLSRSSLNLIKIIIIFIPKMIMIRKLDENTKVLLQNFLYQDYQRVTQIQLSERVKLTAQMTCLRSITVQQSL